jgi:hypothetical protein
MLKNTAFFQKPRVFSGFLCVDTPWLWAALICTQSCNSVQTRANPCELYGTIRGTSAPLTAPFFRGIPAPRRSEKPVHCRGSAPAPGSRFRVVGIARVMPREMNAQSTTHPRSKVWSVIDCLQPVGSTPCGSSRNPNQHRRNRARRIGGLPSTS